MPYLSIFRSKFEKPVVILKSAPTNFHICDQRYGYRAKQMQKFVQNKKK